MQESQDKTAAAAERAQTKEQAENLDRLHAKYVAKRKELWHVWTDGPLEARVNATLARASEDKKAAYEALHQSGQ